MAWTTPGTAVAGAVLEASFWNSNVRDNTLHLYAQSLYPYRNLLYNGAMQVAQRGTSSTSISTSGYFTADRWKYETATSTGTWTQTVETADAPTGTGLRQSLKVLCTTANASLDAGDINLVTQYLEGYDVQRIAKGTSSAQQLTLSFWVKSNVTGTYIAELYDEDNTRQVSKAYTISASGTWEKKELTFPADTTGAFTNDNNASLRCNFLLSAGSTYTSGTLNTSWASVTNANRAVGQTNLSAAINNYWQITGVQLEVGSVSTPFEFLPYGDELARCQRYFEKWSSFTVSGYTNATNSVYVFLPFAVTKRAACNFTLTTDTSDNVNGTTVAAATGSYGRTAGVHIEMSSASVGFIRRGLLTLESSAEL